MAVDYVTLDEVKDALRVPPEDTVDDLMIAAAITSASRAIDAYCDRYFGRVGTTASPVARLYRANERRVLIDDLVTLTDVEVEYTGNAENFHSLGASSVLPQPVNAPTMSPPWPYTVLLAKSYTVLPPMPGWVRVSGVWGWPAIPRQIKDAAVLQAGRLVKSRDVPLGVLGGDPTLGLMRLPMGLHPDARLLCDPYRRMSGLS